jgi:D-threo-aldose 1-dehydrogenase
MKASEKTALRRGGIELTALGLGCAQMGGMYRDVSLSDCQALLAAAWDAGVRYFDTAPYYGFTRSERRLGALLDGRPRDAFVLSSKAGRLMLPDAGVGATEGEWMHPLPFRPTYDYSHDGIMRSFEASQQRLGQLRIDILFVHDIGRMTHGERHAHTWEQLTTGGGFRALGRLRDENRVGAVGLGVNEWEVVDDAMQAFDIDVTMLAGRYTLLEQTSLAMLDRCQRHGNAIVAAGVFNSGILVGTGKFNYADAPAEIVARTARLRTCCERFGVPMAAAALQFPLHHPAVVSCVVGARSADQFRGNVAWLETPIPPAFWQQLKQDGLLHESAPVPVPVPVPAPAPVPVAG